MERDFLKTRRRRQVFPKCIFWVVFKNLILFIQDNLLKRTMALWGPKKKENCACLCLSPQLISSKQCVMFNKPFQNVKYGRQRKLNYTSIPSAFSLAKSTTCC